MLLWTGGKWIEGLPPGLKSLSEPAAVGISPLGMLVLIIAATGAWTLSRTAFGRDFYAVGITRRRAPAGRGGEPHPHDRLYPQRHAGGLRRDCVCRADRLCAQPDRQRAGDESHRCLRAGGISLLGGTGTLVGAFLGAFFLTQIDTVLVLFRLPAWWNDFIAGLVLLGVLVLDGRLRQALARHQRALKYSRFQPGNKGGKHVTPFPKRKKRWRK